MANLLFDAERKNKERRALGWVHVRMDGVFLILQQVGVHLLCKRPSVYPNRSLCAATHMSPVPCSRRMRCAVLNVGLHHSCCLRRGGCNPILFGEAVVQPVRRERALLCCSDALPSTPPLSAECHPLSPSSVHSLLGEAGRRRTRLRDRCIALFTPPTEPHLSRRDAAELFPLIFFFFECLYRGNLPHARHSGDVPGHVHIRDGVGFT